MSEQWKAYLKNNQKEFLNDFIELLKIPSISTDPQYQEAVSHASEWIVRRLKRAGIENARAIETDGHPIVYGEWIHAENKPTLLIYGHYDVQPPDPLDLWHSAPFDPLTEDGIVYARGSSDMKGNLLLPIIACEALLETDGELPVNIKFLFEGEEEIFSPSLISFLKKHHDQLTSDLAVSADGSVGSKEEPTLVKGLRGMCALQIDVKTAQSDIHSGLGGGIAPNAIQELVHLLDSMRDEQSRIIVEGFYDNVCELTSDDKNELSHYANFPFEQKASSGFKRFFGETDYSPIERNVARPTLEINGIWGGYQGEGLKTVIPCEAHAKITARLVPNQTPEEISEKLTAHLIAHVADGVEVSVVPEKGSALTYRLSDDSTGAQVLEKLLNRESGHEVKQVLIGGSVAIYGLLQQTLGINTLSIGASGTNGNAHAPNENYQLSDFERAQKLFIQFFQMIGLLDAPIK